MHVFSSDKLYSQLVNKKAIVVLFLVISAANQHARGVRVSMIRRLTHIYAAAHTTSMCAFMYTRKLLAISSIGVLVTAIRPGQSSLLISPEPRETRY